MLFIISFVVAHGEWFFVQPDGTDSRIKRLRRAEYSPNPTTFLATWRISCVMRVSGTIFTSSRIIKSRAITEIRHVESPALFLLVATKVSHFLRRFYFWAPPSRRFKRSWATRSLVKRRSAHFATNVSKMFGHFLRSRKLCQRGVAFLRCVPPRQKAQCGERYSRAFRKINANK